MLVYLATLALALGVARRTLWDAAIKDILPEYMYAPMIEARVAPPKTEGPLIVWLGDSTLLEGKAKIAYPTVVTTELQRRMQSRVVAAPGIDSYGHYFLMDRVLAMRPVAIVIVAHLRFLGEPNARPNHTHVTMNDLARYLEPAEIPAALRLPLAERHLTLPRLVLAQALNIRAVSDWFLFLEGLHHLGARAFEGRGEMVFVDPAANTLRDAYVTIDARSPGVRMLAGAVAKARQRNVPTLVIGTPLPMDVLVAAGRVTRPEVEATFDVLAQAVAGSGGTFLDLHDALRPDELGDNAGHFTPVGVARMSLLVTPELRRLLAGRRAAAPPGQDDFR